MAQPPPSIVASSIWLCTEAHKCSFSSQITAGQFKGSDWWISWISFPLPLSITYWWEKTLAIAVLSVWCNGLGQGWADARTEDLATFQLACDMCEIINLFIVLFLNRVSWSEKSVNACSEIVQKTSQCVRSGVHGKMGGI